MLIHVVHDTIAQRITKNQQIAIVLADIRLYKDDFLDLQNSPFRQIPFGSTFMEKYINRSLDISNHYKIVINGELTTDIIESIDDLLSQTDYFYTYFNNSNMLDKWLVLKTKLKELDNLL